MVKLKKEPSYKVEDIQKSGIKKMTCSKTGKRLPISEFRIHKNGYYLSYCKDWEREQSRNRAKATKISNGNKAKSTAKKKATKIPKRGTFKVETLRGVEVEASAKPFENSKEVKSVDTKTVLFFDKNIKRSDMVSAFKNVTNVDDIKTISVKNYSKEKSNSMKNVAKSSRKSKIARLTNSKATKQTKKSSKKAKA